MEFILSINWSPLESYLSISVQKGGFSNLVKIVRVVCTLGRNKTLIKIWLEQNMHKHELT